MKKFFKIISGWAKGIMLSILGKQIVPTDRRDWGKDYGM
jgi:hypothetical protein